MSLLISGTPRKARKDEGQMSVTSTMDVLVVYLQGSSVLGYTKSEI